MPLALWRTIQLGLDLVQQRLTFSNNGSRMPLTERQPIHEGGRLSSLRGRVLHGPCRALTSPSGSLVPPAPALLLSFMQDGRQALPGTIAPYALLAPAVGMSMSSLVYGERFSIIRLWGMILLLTGVAITAALLNRWLHDTASQR